jgi:hypothetical protein
MFGALAGALIAGLVHQPTLENAALVGTPKEKKPSLKCTAFASKFDGASTRLPECAPAMPFNSAHTVGKGVPVA